MSALTNVSNTCYTDFQSIPAPSFENIFEAQLNNVRDVQKPAEAFAKLFPFFEEGTPLNAVEKFVQKTLTLSSQNVDCSAGKKFPARMEHIASNLGFENSFAVLVHCYNLASNAGHNATAQAIKDRLQRLFEENQDKASSIGPELIAFNIAHVDRDFKVKLEKHSSEKVVKNSINWTKIILGLGAALVIGGGIYYGNRIVSEYRNSTTTKDPLQTLQDEKLELQGRITKLDADNTALSKKVKMLCNYVVFQPLTGECYDIDANVNDAKVTDAKVKV